MGGIIGLVILVLDVIAIINVLKSSFSTGKKVLWIALIVILPLIGLIAWYLVGRK